MTDVSAITASDAYQVARACIRDTDELTLAHMCESTRIAAPSAHEAERGRWFAARLRDTGLTPEVDQVGNVIAYTPAAAANARGVVVASHLDTVFALDTSLAVTRRNGRLTGPGISDNSRGLAGSLALARALHAAGWPLHLPVAFLGTVGEEGAGDLRGVKHFIAQHGARTLLFIALDGAGATRIINAGVGSRRLRVTYRGPGGHSWSDWGAPNAIHAAGRAVHLLTALPLPERPRTTLSVGRIGGGTSINAIPGEAWLELDLRSTARAPLQQLETSVRDALESARLAEDGSGRLECVIDVFGDRPAGRTPEDHPLVQAAIAATHAIGAAPELAASSTDANVPMASGIPAIAIGAGGRAGGTHTVNEWYDNDGGTAGLERALMIVLAAAQLTSSNPPR